MIEVERKFRPTEEQLAKLLEGAEFLGEKNLHDIYYDYPDYRLLKKHIFLRKRNDGFELKTENEQADTHKELSLYNETEDEEEIKKFFNTIGPIEVFIEKNLEKSREFKTTRRKYKKGEFNIDVDDLDFGYKCIEIELLVEDDSKIEEAKNKIINFAQNYGLSMEKVPSKRQEYLRIKKPEVYKELYS